jgi:hypothetical protein
MPSTGFAEDPLADRDDEARIFSNRHELRRHQEPSIGMSRADERFGTDHRATLQIHFGLIVQDELAPLDGPDISSPGY